jgi:tetratricopeptide (TPR) repeat protein
MPQKITAIAATLATMASLVCLPAQKCNAAAPDRSTEELWHNYCERGDQAEIERDYPKAENCFRQAMATADTFGPNSKQMQTSIARMGTILVLQAHFEQAETYFLKSLMMVKNMRKQGEPDPDALVWLDDFGDAYQEMGKKIKTKNMFCLEHVVALREMIAPGRHSKLASACNELAGLYMTAKKYEEAEKLINLQIVCISNKYGAKAQIMTPLSNLAVVQEKQGKFALAETSLTKAISQMEQHQMPPQFIAECRKDLVRIQAEGAAKAKSGK